MPVSRMITCPNETMRSCGANTKSEACPIGIILGKKQSNGFGVIDCFKLLVFNQMPKFSAIR